MAGKIHKDKESGLGLAVPRKRGPKTTSQVDEDLDDDLAGLLGGLSVDARQCDVCSSDLTTAESKRGEARCAACRADLEDLSRSAKIVETKAARGAKGKEPRRGRRIVLDSDDEGEAAGGVLVTDETEGVEEGGRGDHGDDSGSQAEEGTDTSEDENGTTRRRRHETKKFIDLDEDSDDDSSEDGLGLVISTKIKYLLKVLKKELKAKNKTIVFSQFTSMLNLIEPFLHREGIAFTRYDGSMKNDDREASLRRLRGEGEYKPRKGREEESWCGVLLCSLKCGALGLNLTTACRVVILEPFWNPVRCPPSILANSILTSAASVYRRASD